VRASFTPGIADVVARYQRGEPVLFYSDTPDWPLAKLIPDKDVVFLNVPASACPSSQPCGSSTTGFAVNDIDILANSAFLSDNPAAKAVLERVRIPIADVNQVYLKLLNDPNNGSLIQDGVDSWIAANQSEFDSWVNAGAAAGGNS